MKPLEDNTTRAEDASPGLPWFRTWRGVYRFVIGCFILYVVLLAALKWAFP